MARNIDKSRLVVIEGKLVAAYPAELDRLRSELTPMTVLALEAFLER